MVEVRKNRRAVAEEIMATNADRNPIMPMTMITCSPHRSLYCSIATAPVRDEQALPTMNVVLVVPLKFVPQSVKRLVPRHHAGRPTRTPGTSMSWLIRLRAGSRKTRFATKTIPNFRQAPHG